MRNNGFQKTFQDMLRQKNCEIKQKISADAYVIAFGRSEFKLDTSAARHAYEKDRDISVLETVIRRMETDHLLEDRLDNFANAQTGLRCLLVPEHESGEGWMEVPFSDNIRLKKRLMYAGSEENIFPLGTAYLKKWGVPKEVLFAVADRNMCDLLRKTELYVSTIAGKIKVVEFHTENVRLRTALMACSNFKKLVSEKLGVRFLVLAPSQESMLAVEDVRNDVIECFGPVVLKEFEKSAAPLSTDVFLFSQNGISVAGKFRAPEMAGVLV